jgi:hypothetical protein
MAYTCSRDGLGAVIFGTDFEIVRPEDPPNDTDMNWPPCNQRKNAKCSYTFRGLPPMVYPDALLWFIFHLEIPSWIVTLHLCQILPKMLFHRLLLKRYAQPEWLVSASWGGLAYSG